MSGDRPFDALKVVELSGGIAAAYAGKMLIDAGAAVRLLEPVGGSDLRRRHAAAMMGRAPELPAGETGALFRYLSRDKQGGVLPSDEAAMQTYVEGLCAEADVLIHDHPLATFGIDAERLRAARPALSIVSISPWGENGPYAQRSATEFVLQAETGSLAWRGYADRPPLATGGELGDYIAGSFAAVAAATAWRAARRDGKGRAVDLSQFEAMLICLQPYQYIHGELQPGELVPASVDVPSIERARDGWVGYATITDEQWRAFAAMIGHPELGYDDSLRFGIQRFAAIDRLGPLIAAYTESRTVAELVDEALRRRIPVTPMGDARTVLEMEHFRARGVFQPAPEGIVEPRRPWSIAGEGAPPRGSAPALPAHETQGAEGSDWPARRPGTGSPQPFADLKVLDMSAFWAGPMAGEIYAALGADVLKLEAVQRPDGMRYAGGFAPSGKPMWECSPIFLGANAGKRAITLDLTRPAGLDLAKRLIAESDIVIENFTPRVMENFGLGWEAIQAINPRAILLRMPAFGLDGPWRDRTGFAMTMEQVSGMAAQTGYPDRPPVPPRGCVDPIGGVNGFFATLAALELRERDGRGRLVEASLAEAGVAISAEPVVDQQTYGTHLERSGNSGPGAVPQGVFACSDGASIALSVATDAQWRGLTQVMGTPELDAPEWQTAAGRRAEEEAILALLARWCASRSSEEALNALLGADVPAAPLRNVRTLHEHPQLEGRGFFARMEHPVAGSIGFPSLPFRIDGRYPAPTAPAPLLGEHNEAVLRDHLGLDEDAMTALEQDRIIGKRPVRA